MGGNASMYTDSAKSDQQSPNQATNENKYLKPGGLAPNNQGVKQNIYDRVAQYFQNSAAVDEQCKEPSTTLLILFKL